MVSKVARPLTSVITRPLKKVSSSVWLAATPPAAAAPAPHDLDLGKKSKRNDYTFRHPFDEKASILPGCPGSRP